MAKSSLSPAGDRELFVSTIAMLMNIAAVVLNDIEQAHAYHALHFISMNNRSTR